MANAGSGKLYESINDACNQSFKALTSGRSSKGSREMVLDLGIKPEVYVSDETPTPIRLIRNCEEMGLFQDLQNENPFEETFRKATEDIRSGSSQLEISSLSVPSNIDDSLHTPHVIFPSIGEPEKSSCSIRLPVIQHDADSMGFALDSEEPNRIVQQEADTSEELHPCEAKDTNRGDVSPKGTVQFLLRLPNGKMVQLSSLPVELMDGTQATLKDLPTLKVDSSASKGPQNDLYQATCESNSSARQTSKDSVSSSSSGSIVVSSGRDSVLFSCQSKQVKGSSLKTSNAPASMDSTTLQPSKMSLAKLRLKQALLNNSCPAASPSTSSRRPMPSAPVSGGTNLSTTTKVFSGEVPRRSSSTSDEGLSRSVENQSVEEKRLRNRAAAMRCREKRKTWVRELERRANDMLRTNGQLQHEVSLLRDEVAQLKTLLLAHKDCPVTQALALGPLGNAPNLASQEAQATLNGVQIKEAAPPNSTLLIQAPATTLKPVILLGDPPTKRKRVAQPYHESVNSMGVASKPSVSAVAPTIVVTPVSNSSSKSSAVLNSSFLNVLPSVLMTNSSSCPTVSTSSSPCIMAVSNVASAVAPFRRQVGPFQKQPFILPKSENNSYLHEDKVSKCSKIRSSHILSTNVIKVNPNIFEKLSENLNSDIEFLDAKSPDRYS